MISVARYILLFFLLLLLFGNIYAQPNPAVLPSLFNNKRNNFNNNDSSKEAALIKQKLFVKVFTSKSKIFVGEPVMATYKFYVSMQVSDQPSVIKQPEFSGCSVKELDFEQGPEVENINNESYAVYTIRKVQLTPLQPGMLSLGKAFVNNNIMVSNAEEQYALRKYDINVNNADAAIEVIGLPAKNKSKDFYGITGVFDIAAAVSKNKIAVGESNHLIVSIKGAGNLDAIVKPDIKWPVNIEHFDGSDSQHIDEHNFPVSGEHLFDIPFISKKEGTTIIPPIEFSFFNTESHSYQTVSTDSIRVTFTKASAKKNEFTNIVNYDITNRKYLWIVPAIAVIVALIGFISYRKSKSRINAEKAASSITPAPVFAQPQPDYRVRYRTDFSRYLNELQNIIDHKQFFTKAKDLLTKAIAERIDSTQYSEQILLYELKQRIYNAPVCNKVAALYEVFNLNLYAPFETQPDLEFYFTELKGIVEELQSES